MMQIKAQVGTGYAPYYTSRAARNSRRALVALSSVALSVILVCIFLNLPVYVRSLDKSMPPKLFYIGFMLLLFPILLSRLHAFLSYLTSPFGLWALALLLLNLLHLITDAGSLTARGEMLVSFRLQAIGMVLFLGFAFTHMRQSGWERSFVLLAVLVPSLVIADFLYPGRLYPPDTAGTVLGRASGTFINPTIAGEVILLVFLLAYPMVRKRYHTALVILAGIAVLVTFTRAAMISWLALWVFLMLRRRLPAVSAITALAVVMLPLAMGGLESYISKRGDFTSAIENIEHRLMFFSKGRVDDDSATERAAVLQAGWEAFVAYPLTGIGAGVTDGGQSRLWPHAVGTHNQLVALGAEYGVVGVIMWLWLLMLMLRGRYFHDRTIQTAVILLFCAMTFFTHNMFDFPYWLLTFALLSQRDKVEPGAVAKPAS